MAEQEAKKLYERAFPQLSLRFIFSIVGVSAFAFAILRYAWVSGSMWAMAVSMMIVTSLVCFCVYGLLFSISQIFVGTTKTILATTNLVGDEISTDNASDRERT